jgi:hypothetical protein
MPSDLAMLALIAIWLVAFLGFIWVCQRLAR